MTIIKVFCVKLSVSYVSTGLIGYPCFTHLSGKQNDACYGQQVVYSTGSIDQKIIAIATIRHSRLANPSSDTSEFSRATIGENNNNNNNKPTPTHIQTHLCRNNEVLYCSQTTKTAKNKRNLEMTIYIQTQVYVRDGICLKVTVSWFHINCLYRSSRGSLKNN